MARRMSTLWVGAVTAVALAACGAVVEEPPQLEANPPGTDQEVATEDPEASAPDDPGGQDPDRETDGDDPGDGAHRAGPTQDGDDDGPPWHLLPEDDRPGPVEQPECEPADLRPEAC